MTKGPLFLSVVLSLTPAVSRANAVSDDFEDGTLDTSLWNTSLPSANSAVTEANGLLTLTSRGTLSTSAEFRDYIEIRGSFRINDALDNLKVAFRSDLSTYGQYAELSGMIVEFNGQGGTFITPAPPDGTDAVTGNFANPVGQFHDFLIRDTGSQIFVFIDDLLNPVLTMTSNYRTGQKVAFYNRELPGLKTDLASIEINDIQSPSISITGQPASAEVPLGGDASFQVEATGAGTLHYQWWLNGSRLDGATSESLSVANVAEPDFGSYTVTIIDDNGSAESQPAQLILFVDSDGDGLSDRYERGYGRYELVQGAFTWQQAEADAESKGGHLATIISSEEWDSIRAVVGTSNLEGNVIWIGGTDVAIEGQWQWITGETFTFTNWRAGEPNSTAGGGESDFIEMTQLAGSPWNDAFGTEVRSYYLLEFGYFTDPNKPDTDGDGFNDDVEIQYGSIPTLTSSVPVARFSVVPVSQTVTNGTDVILTAEVSGLGPISLQWLHNGVIIPGETNSALILPAIGRDDVGDYTITATNPAGTISSPVAELVVTPIASLQLLSDGFLFIRIQNIRPGPWRVESTSDFKTWDSVGTATFNNGVSALLDTVPPGAGHRFYRAVSP